MTNLDEAKTILKKIVDKHSQFNKSADGNLLLEKSVEDFSLFRSLHHAFSCVEDLLLYYIMRSVDRDTYDLIKLKKIKFPENSDQLLELYRSFPAAIDKIHDDLYEIISLDTFDLLLIYKKIPINLFYSITGEDSGKIVIAKDDIQFLLAKSNYLVKSAIGK